MNKHTRLAVGILVLVLVLLIVATVSFSINISKKSAGSQNSTFDTGTNSNGNVIVEGDDHLRCIRCGRQPDSGTGMERIAFYRFGLPFCRTGKC